MGVDYNTIKSTMADNIADAIASASRDAMSSLPVLGNGIEATWNGVTTVQVPDTSSLQVGYYLNKIADGNWYKITSVLTSSVIVQDIYEVGSFPTGGGPVSLSATLTWDGTTVVSASYTSELSVGEAITLDSDGQWFTIGDITGNDVTILPGQAAVIPTGATGSSKAGSSFTTLKLPSPPQGSEIVDKIGTPIAEPVVDDGIQAVQNTPRVIKLESFTVAQANAIATKVVGDMIYVTDDIGGAIPAFWDGSNWRCVNDRGIISVI